MFASFITISYTHTAMEIWPVSFLNRRLFLSVFAANFQQRRFIFERANLAYVVQLSTPDTMAQSIFSPKWLVFAKKVFQKVLAHHYTNIYRAQRMQSARGVWSRWVTFGFGLTEKGKHFPLQAISPPPSSQKQNSNIFFPLFLWPLIYYLCYPSIHYW